MKEEMLRLERVTYIEDGVMLLDNFNLHIFKGEIMGLISANALGRKALIQLMCQNIPIHYGYVYFRESLVNSYEHSSMSMNQVAVIEKRSRLVENLTVTDNIFVLRRGFKKYIINPKVLNSQLEYYTKELDIHIRGDELVADLTFFEKCVVELLKAIITGASIVIVKDVSNFISAADLVKIHKLIEHYAGDGLSFLYVCNHHEDVFKVSHRAALMENGKILKIFDRTEFRDEMVAPYCKPFFQAVSAQDKKYSDKNSTICMPIQQSAAEDGVLQFNNVSIGTMHNMSFTVLKGECVVFLDMNNTVLNDMQLMMNGERMPEAGTIKVDGKLYKKNWFRKENSVGIIKEKPTHSMLFKEMSYLDNLCFMADSKQPLIWVNSSIKKSVAKEYGSLAGADIYADNIAGLSARSRYNLVYYRMHLLHPKVVFCVQPFAEADMELRVHIIDLINQLRERQIAVVILAVSLSDSLMVADRLLVVEQGRLQEEIERKEFHAFGLNQ